jgi:hypothetical protein
MLCKRRLEMFPSPPAGANQQIQIIPERLAILPEIGMGELPLYTERSNEQVTCLPVVPVRSEESSIVPRADHSSDVRSADAPRDGAPETTRGEECGIIRNVEGKTVFGTGGAEPANQPLRALSKRSFARGEIRGGE